MGNSYRVVRETEGLTDREESLLRRLMLAGERLDPGQLRALVESLEKSAAQFFVPDDQHR